MTSLFLEKKVLKPITGFIIIIGIALRISVWLQQRSIFLDEANLIRNFLEKSYISLFGHLSYEQYSPPCFSIVSKFMLSVFGVNELSTRAFPLLCGLALLLVFYKLCRYFLSPLALLLALSFLVFGKIFIDYSTECKQYATDAFIAVSLVLLSQIIDYKAFNFKKTVLWIGIGSLSILFSMPSVFVLTGVGAYYFTHFLKEKKHISNIVIVCFCWLIVFALYFFFVLKPEARSNGLQTFHNDHFFAFPPLNTQQFNLLINQIEGIIDSCFGQTILAALLAAIGFLWGLRSLWTENKSHFVLLVTPILLTLVASSCHYYSLIARLTLFFLPIFMLIVFIGFDALLKKQNLIISGIILVGLIPTLFLRVQILNLFELFTNNYSELKTGLNFIKSEIRQDEILFMYHNASPVGRFYTQYCDKPYQFNKLLLQEYTCCDPNIYEQGLIALRQKGEKRIWVLHDQPDFAFLEEFIKKENGQVLKKYEFHRGVAILYEIK